MLLSMIDTEDFSEIFTEQKRSKKYYGSKRVSHMVKDKKNYFSKKVFEIDFLYGKPLRKTNEKVFFNNEVIKSKRNSKKSSGYKPSVKDGIEEYLEELELAKQFYLDWDDLESDQYCYDSIVPFFNVPDEYWLSEIDFWKPEQSFIPEEQEPYYYDDFYWD